MSKYPISREFFPFNHFTPPINAKFLKLAAKHMNVPRRFLKAKGFSITKHRTKSNDGAPVSFYLISPEELKGKAPCLVYIHGGGFVLKAAGYHYMNCLRYAKEAGCRVVFPDYRLAPDHPFPQFFEDCYAIFSHICDKADVYGIDTKRMGVGGDSAGATLSAGLYLMTRERNHPVKLLFQLLIYPFLDARSESESCKKYTDTPMWNSSLSDRVGDMTKVDKDHPSYLWYSPAEISDYSIYPPSYVETAEFDCLHDDGILFAKGLRNAGVPVALNETKGTMHGYDIKTSASISKKSMKQRIAFMKRMFYR